MRNLRCSGRVFPVRPSDLFWRNPSPPLDFQQIFVEEGQRTVTSDEVPFFEVLSGVGPDLEIRHREQLGGTSFVFLGEPNLVSEEFGAGTAAQQGSLVSAEHELSSVLIDLSGLEHSHQNICQVGMQAGIKFINARMLPEAIRESS